MRYSHLDKLFTIEGLIIAAVVLPLTLLICRPRKPRRNGKGEKDPWTSRPPDA